MGLDISLEHKDRGENLVHAKSKKYPDHLFRIGCFRSSYNRLGFDNVMRSRGLPTLADLFACSIEEDEFFPDWSASKTRVELALKSIRKVGKDLGRISITRINCDTFIDNPPKSEKEALDMALPRIREPGTTTDRFETREGEFFQTNHPKVLATIPGKSSFNIPCVYLIYESQTDPLAWYIEALEIILETCEWVLSQPDIEKFYFDWSG